MTAILIRRFWIALGLCFALIACEDIPQYSLQAYSNATEAKAKSLALLAKAEDPYARHSDAAEALVLEMDVAFEFAAGVAGNNAASEMWNIIRDPRENSVGGFIRLWREELPGGLSSGFVEAFERDVRFAFDRLICLESNKREPTACPPLPE